MKIRSDSPFAKLTEDQCDKLLEFSKSMTIEQLVEVALGMPEPIECSVKAMRKFIKRLEKEARLEGIEQDEDLVEMLAKRATNPAVREATLQTMRERMFGVVFDSNNREALMETYRVLNEEKDKERAAGLEERRIRALEENARMAWRKLEYENARAGLKTLPRVRAVLSDASRPAEERVRVALHWLAQMEVNPLLLAEPAPASEARALGVERPLRALAAPEPELALASMPGAEEGMSNEAMESGPADVSGPAQSTGPQSGGTNIGRNKPCPCGSGEKYKRCCGGGLLEASSRTSEPIPR